MWRKARTNKDVGERPVVIQFWDKSPPAEVQSLMDSWRAATNEGFEYHIFSDQTAASFIRQNYDKRTLDAYLSCAVPAMKADFFRYCALFIHPGVYVDADVRKMAPIASLYERLDRGLLFLRGNRLANDFMIIKNRRDPLLATILETTITNIERRISNDVWQVTGPATATRLLKSLGPDDAMFKGIELWPVRLIRKFVRFNWQLDYKLTDSHWVEHQKSHSIFVETGNVEPKVDALDLRSGP